MGKLSNLKPSLDNLSPRIGYAEGDAKASDKARNNLAPWRAPVPHRSMAASPCAVSQ